MRQYQCARNNHVYFGADNSDPGCPHCAAVNAELAKTRPFYEYPPTVVASSASSDGKTIGVYSHLDADIDPVVGWVACVDGPDKGKDWRLVASRNPIGRSAHMAVALLSDNAVSREKHAVIVFEPRRQVFTLLPGDGRGLVYCNGEDVIMPVILKSHDRIEVGKSVLVFVPLAGDKFSWNE